MKDATIVLLGVGVALVAGVGLYEFYEWYLTSGMNMPVSGTPAALAKNTAVTESENAATAASSTTASQASGNATANGALAGGSYNQLSVELEAYDPNVASMLTNADFYAMTGAGFPVTSVNVYMNALQLLYNSEGRQPRNATETTNYLVSIGCSQANASLFAQYLTYGG